MIIKIGYTRLQIDLIILPIKKGMVFDFILNPANQYNTDQIDHLC